VFAFSLFAVLHIRLLFHSPDSSLLRSSQNLMAMEPKKAKTLGTDDVPQWIKNSRARKLRLPRDYAERVDVLEAVTNNRAIRTIDLSECAVRAKELFALHRACGALTFVHFWI
jgi:hypothetical protein